LCSFPNKMYQTPLIKWTHKRNWRSLQSCTSVPWGPPILPPFNNQVPGTWYQAHDTRIKKVHEEESKAAGTWYLARYQVGVPVTWYQVMEGSPRNRYKVNYCLAEILRFFWLYKILQCSCCDHLEHPASCRLNLDHDENSGNLYENWERRFPVRNIYQSQQRQYNRKKKVAMALILTAKTAIADSTIFLHNL